MDVHPSVGRNELTLESSAVPRLSRRDRIVKARPNATGRKRSPHDRIEHCGKSDRSERVIDQHHQGEILRWSRPWRHPAAVAPLGV